MGQETVETIEPLNYVTASQELRLYRMLRRQEELVRSGTIPFDECMRQGRALIERYAPERIVQPPQEKVHDLAEERREAIEKWYRSIGFAMTIPKPQIAGVDVSNRDMKRRAALDIPQELFYTFITSQDSYDAFLSAVGQGSNWTVRGSAEFPQQRRRILWDFSGKGYWFWAEVGKKTPRPSLDWNTLNRTIRLMSLDEYVVFWHTYLALTSEMLDWPVGSHLRTKTSFGGLGARHHDSKFHIGWCPTNELSKTLSIMGGRASELLEELPQAA